MADKEITWTDHYEALHASAAKLLLNSSSHRLRKLGREQLEYLHYLYDALKSADDEQRFQDNWRDSS